MDIDLMLTAVGDNDPSCELHALTETHTSKFSERCGPSSSPSW
jgi:hypothetical protein